jgi:hypothetical protein
VPERLTSAAKVRPVVWVFLLSAWLGQALSANNPLDADAVSYLDISYACLHGNWHALVHGYWSPGYPFLLALWLQFFHVGPSRESLAVHLFAVVSLVLALCAFELCLASFLQIRRRVEGAELPGSTACFSDDAMRLAGYALFFWITTFLTPPYLEQPDILVFAVYLVICALCLRIFGTSAKLSGYALLGVLLGVAYLVKAVMFPLAFVFLAVLLLCKEWKRVWPRVALALLAFAVVSTPYIYELSHSKGRLTWGDAGAVNYRQMIDPPEETASSRLSNAPGAAPHMTDFTSILPLGTFPPWGDPSYGYQGGGVHFSLGRQLTRIHVDLKYYFELYFEQLAAVATCFLAIIFLIAARRGFARGFLRFRILWVPALLGLGLYALVRAEGRMLAGFTMALFLPCFGAWHGEDSHAMRKVSRSLLWAMCTMLALTAAVRVGHQWKLSGPANSTDWAMASALQNMGVEPGDLVCYMGYALTDHGWAHLARVRIVSEIPAEDVLGFWSAGQEQQNDVAKWLEGRKAKAMITRDAPPVALSRGWRKIPGTEYYVLLLATK